MAFESSFQIEERAIGLIGRGELDACIQLINTENFPRDYTLREMGEALRKQYGTEMPFADFMRRLGERIQTPGINLTDEELSVTDHLELALIFAEGRDERVRPFYTISLYHLGMVFAALMPDAVVWLPQEQAGPAEMAAAFQHYHTGTDFPVAEAELRPLAERMHPEAMLALGDTLRLLGKEKDEYQWGVLGRLMTPYLLANPLSMYAAAVYGSVRSLEQLRFMAAGKRGTPSLPLSDTVNQILDIWTFRFYEEMADRHFGYGMVRLSEMVKEERPNQSREWFRRAAEAGYGPAARTLYWEHMTPQREKAFEGNADYAELRLAGRYAHIAAASGIADMRAEDGEAEFLMDISRGEERRIEREETIARAREEAAEKMKEYRRKLDTGERLFNFLGAGVSFTAKELEDFGLAMHDSDILQAGGLERMVRESKEQDYLDKLMEKLTNQR